MCLYPLEAIATPAAERSLDAASQADITRSSIAQAMAALAKEGGRMTQMAIASHQEFARAADVSQGWVIGGGSIVGNESSASKDKNTGLKMFFDQSIGAV